MVRFLFILLVIAFLGVTTYSAISGNITAINELFKGSSAKQTTSQIVDIQKSQVTLTPSELAVYKNLTDEQNLASLESDLKEFDSLDAGFEADLKQL